MLRFLAAAALLLPAMLAAQQAPPKLLVVIAVDQLSADLFAQYRPHFSGGLKRLSQGAVFPSGYQSHAATETCPGHATILTGAYPARSGIIANNWIDQNAPRADKSVYCAEDERVAGSTFRAYTPSAAHLLVPTLGDAMKAANPASRNVAVAGKDRAAIMMGGANTDAIWFTDPFKKRSMMTLPGQTATGSDDAARVTATIEKSLARAMPPMKPSPRCAALARPVRLNDRMTVGDGRFARKAGDVDAFRASPEADAAVLAMASALVQSMKLGQGNAPDLLAIGLSATDYVGHRYGTEGSEICLQLTALDAALDTFFKRLDAAKIDYAVALTADHGGHDTPERNRENALPEAARLDMAASVRTFGAAIGKELGIAGPVLLAADLGDIWIDKMLSATDRARVETTAVAKLSAHPQVAAVFTAAQIAATDIPKRPPETWTLIERARASFHPARSGDLLVLLKPRVTPIPEPGTGYIATHGSPWDYDRRVPMLFWRAGMAGFEQPNSVEVVDVAPTLAALVGVPFPGGDGRCLDLIAGPATSCP